MPVGEDQRQHLELTRDLAQRFNHRFGKTFVVPEPYIVKETAKIYDLQEPDAQDEQVGLVAHGIIDPARRPEGHRQEDQVRGDRRRAARSASTPARSRGSQPADHPLGALPGRPVADLEKRVRRAAATAHLKKELAEVVVEFVTPFRNRTFELLEDRAELDQVLAAGAEKASAVAEATLRDVYERVGFVAPAGR